MSTVNSNQGQSGFTPLGAGLIGAGLGAAPGYAIAQVGKHAVSIADTTRDQLNSAHQAIERRGSLDAARADLADISEGRWMVRRANGEEFGKVGATTKTAQAQISKALFSGGTKDASAHLIDGAIMAQRGVESFGRLQLRGELLGVAGILIGAGLGVAKLASD